MHLMELSSMTTEKPLTPLGKSKMFTVPQQLVWMVHRKSDIIWKFLLYSQYLGHCRFCFGGVNNHARTFLCSCSLPVLYTKANVLLGTVRKTKRWERQGNWRGGSSTQPWRGPLEHRGTLETRNDLWFVPQQSLRFRAHIRGLQDSLGSSWHLEGKQ